MSLLVKSETLELFLNIWIADDKYSIHTRENILHSFKTFLSKKQKTFDQFSILYLKEININVTTEDKRHLGAVLGSKNFCDEYASGKVSDWCDELDRLSEIAKSQPQAAYTGFIHGH